MRHLSPGLRRYLRAVASLHAEDLDGSEEAAWTAERDAAWEQLGDADKALANEVVEAMFGDWL